MRAHQDKRTGSRIIKASEFKATCLKLMDEVAETGEEIVITKNGQPVSRAGAVPREARTLVRPQSGQHSDKG